MEFCPICGSRLVPKKFESGDSVVFACSKCGYVKQESDGKPEAKGGKVIQHNLQQLITVIGKEEQKLNTIPTMKMKCPKCENMLVYVWQVQTRGGDEASTQFFRCTKCNHTFREYT
jgi:DNA-directed RNA polymerase subunit M